MQRVKIHIRVRRIGDGEDFAQDQILTGDLAEKDGVLYAFYREQGEGMEGVRTTLRWNESSLVVSRSGGVESRQEFRNGYRCCSVYKTPYLAIPLVSITRKLLISRQRHGHRLELEYDLQHGDAPYGRMIILMEIEEKKA